jgi:DNA mismatch endonuclease (patch repair protein)
VSLVAPPPSSDAATAVMRGNVGRDSRPEVLVRSALHRAGLRFRKNQRVYFAGGAVRPDVVFPGRRVAVFLDGCYWHRCPTHGTSPRTNAEYWASKLDGNVRRDSLVNERLRAEGWTVVRIWEHVAPDEAARRIAAAVDLWGKCETVGRSRKPRGRPAASEAEEGQQTKGGRAS